MRKRLYEVIEVSNGKDKLSSIYDWSMIVFIICSLIPLAYKTTNQFFYILDQTTVIIFVIDYILRLITADFRRKF